ncbi:hypothetical protein B0H14DRAFT_2635204 [Mycena olivaceomarginata]|nr:hypothetical protein B0H14DRAFT_2635204 [Mycena olivaceomarginata]
MEPRMSSETGAFGLMGHTYSFDSDDDEIPFIQSFYVDCPQLAGLDALLPQLLSIAPRSQWSRRLRHHIRGAASRGFTDPSVLNRAGVSKGLLWWLDGGTQMCLCLGSQDERVPAKRYIEQVSLRPWLPAGMYQKRESCAQWEKGVRNFTQKRGLGAGGLVVGERCAMSAEGGAGGSTVARRMRIWKNYMLVSSAGIRTVKESVISKLSVRARLASGCSVSSVDAS